MQRPSLPHPSEFTVIHRVLYWHDAGTPYSADTDCDKNEIAFITEQHIKTNTTSIFPPFSLCCTQEMHADYSNTGTGIFFLALF